MSEVGQYGDILQAYLTGAVFTDAYQADVQLSLGGYRSSVRALGCGWNRYNAISGLRVDYVSRACGFGLGVIGLEDSDTVTWTPPSGTIGTAVAIANGETKQVAGASANMYIIVTRTSANPLSGNETLGVRAAFNTVWATQNYDTVTYNSGAYNYRGVILRFAQAVTACTIWFDAGCTKPTALYKEALSSGAIQTVSADLDVPTTPPAVLVAGIPSEGSPHSLGAFDAGDEIALWVGQSRDVSEACNPLCNTVLHYAYTAGGIDYAGSFGGLYRQAQPDIEGWCGYAGIGAWPETGGTPDFFSATLPATPPLAAGYDWYLRCCYRNSWGIIGPSDPIYDRIIRVAAGGTEDPTRPQGPGLTEICAWGVGEARVRAAYYAVQEPDATYKAGYWVIYVTGTGVAPDPTSDTQVILKMIGARGGDNLLYVTDGNDWLEDTPIEALVHTRRLLNELTGSVDTKTDSDTADLEIAGHSFVAMDTVDVYWEDGARLGMSVTEVADDIVSVDGGTGDDLPVDGTSIEVTVADDYVDSNNTATATDTVEWFGPARVAGRASLGDLYTVHQAPTTPPATSTVYVNQGLNIRFVMNPGSVAFYADSTLIWTLYRDDPRTDWSGIKSEFAWTFEEVSGASGGAYNEAIDYSEYVSSGLLYVCVNDVRRMKIDVTNGVIYCAAVNGVTAVSTTLSDSPAWCKWAHTCFQVWGAMEENYVTGMSLDDNGILYVLDGLKG